MSKPDIDDMTEEEMRGNYELHSQSIDVTDIVDMTDMPENAILDDVSILKDSVLVEWLEERD